MAVHVACPFCSKEISIKDELKGKRIRCPRCKKPFQSDQEDDPEPEETPEESQEPHFGYGLEEERESTPRRRPASVKRRKKKRQRQGPVEPEMIIYGIIAIAL